LRIGGDLRIGAGDLRIGAWLAILRLGQHKHWGVVPEFNVKMAPNFSCESGGKTTVELPELTPNKKPGAANRKIASQAPMFYGPGIPG
jgi:hypothetical protein